MPSTSLPLASRPGWITLRRAVQVACVAGFFWLFRATESTGADELTRPVNLLFRLDPLTALCALLASKTMLWIVWPAGLTVLLTLFLGRVFCGWICPLGTLLDWAHRLVSPIHRRLAPRTARFARWLPAVRYGVLTAVLVAAFGGLQLVGVFDPFALLVRGLAAAVDPALWDASAAWFGWSEHAPAWLHRGLDPLNAFLRSHALPFQRPQLGLAAVSLGMLAFPFALELAFRRGWCRYVCPLGAMLGLLGRRSVLRRLPVVNCKKCPAAADCHTICRMNAFTPSGQFEPDACTLCMDCFPRCPGHVARLKPGSPKPAPAPVAVSRRAFLGSVATGVALPIVARAAAPHAAKTPPSTLLRPPGAGSEDDFLSQCVRCGECLKVCPTNALQPTLLEAGLGGMFAPRLVPRTGYCEHACTLCGQVCPTAAIPRLGVEAKKNVVIGKAVFDLDRCLPWAKNEECICCEEHCPVPDKAIHFDEVQVKNAAGQTVTLQRPYVILDRCIGCGICENKCPIDGPAGVVVQRPEHVSHPGPRHERRRRRNHDDHG